MENLQKHWVSNNKLIKVFWLPNCQGCLFSHLTEYCSLAVLGNIMGNLQTTHEFQSIHVILMPQNIQKPQHPWHGPPSLESSLWIRKDDITTLSQHWGEGTPFPESQNFLDKFGKNLVILCKFSRFVIEKINSLYPKKNTKVSHFFGGGGGGRNENFPKPKWSVDSSRILTPPCPFTVLVIQFELPCLLGIVLSFIEI